MPLLVLWKSNTSLVSKILKHIYYISARTGHNVVFLTLTNYIRCIDSFIMSSKANTKTSLKLMLIFCISANIQIIYVKAPTYEIFINMILIFVRKEASVKMPSHNHHHHHHHHHLCCHHHSVIIINALISITFNSTPHQK